MVLVEQPKLSRSHRQSPASSARSPGPFPAEVELILSAIETGQYSRRERRRDGRAEYRAQARLQLYSDMPDTPHWTLYTRDVNPRGAGFITPHRLPLGHGGLIELPTPDGGLVRSIPCTLLRCREAAPGWYEGSLYFNRHQPDFSL